MKSWRSIKKKRQEAGKPSKPKFYVQTNYASSSQKNCVKAVQLFHKGDIDWVEHLPSKATLICLSLVNGSYGVDESISACLRTLGCSGLVDAWVNPQIIAGIGITA